MALRNRRLATLILFVGLAILHTWPLATAPGTLSRNDNADASLNEWIIAWVAHQTPHDPLHLFDANIFYPERRTLAFSEHLFVPSMMGAPVLWLGGSPVLTFNLLLIAGLALTGWTTSLLIARWTGDGTAGILAGSLAAFNAHTLTRLPHVQAAHAEFLPLALLALDAVLVRPALGTAMRLALWFTLQALSSGYLMVFSAISLVVGMVVRPADWFGRRARLVVPHLLAAAAVSMAATAFFLVPYYLARTEQGLTRSLEESGLYSASLSDYLSTAGRFHFALWSNRFFRYDAAALFPGVVGLTLTLVSLGTGVAFRDARARMLLGIGVVGFLLSFGPKLALYGWLYRVVPLLEGTRNTSRFGYMTLFAVAGLAGFGLARLRTVLFGQDRSVRRWSLAAAIGLVAVANIEALRAPVGYTPFLGISPVYDRLAREPGAIVAEFPFYAPRDVARNAPYELASTRHWKPLLNGYSGFMPESYAEHFEALRTFPDSSSIAFLRRLGVTHIVIHRDTAPAIADSIQRMPSFAPIAGDADTLLYRLRLSGEP